MYENANNTNPFIHLERAQGYFLSVTHGQTDLKRAEITQIFTKFLLPNLKSSKKLREGEQLKYMWIVEYLLKNSKRHQQLIDLYDRHSSPKSCKTH